MLFLSLNGADDMDDLWTAEMVCKYLGIAKYTLYRYVKDGIVPPPIKLGRNNRWKKSTIEKWVKELDEDDRHIKEIHNEKRE